MGVHMRTPTTSDRLAAVHLARSIQPMGERAKQASFKTRFMGQLIRIMILCAVVAVTIIAMRKL